MQEHATPVFKNVVNALDGFIQSSYPQDSTMELKYSYIVGSRLLLYVYTCKRISVI